MYTYKEINHGEFVVGHVGLDGHFAPESKHNSRAKALAHIHKLQGNMMEQITTAVSDMLFEAWQADGHSKQTTANVYQAIVDGFQDQAIGISLTVHHDDNDYPEDDQ